MRKTNFVEKNLEISKIMFIFVDNVCFKFKLNYMEIVKNIFKAQNGTFKDFWNTLPSNQRDSADFNVRRYWELWGKPKTFNKALKKGAYKLENDGVYHAFSGAWNENGEYEFTKLPKHPTVKYELDWFNSDDAKDFRSKYQLDSTSTPWKYKPINPQQ